MRVDLRKVQCPACADGLLIEATAHDDDFYRLLCSECGHTVRLPFDEETHMSEVPVRIERNHGIPTVRGTWKPIRDRDGELLAASVACPHCACHLRVDAAEVDPETGEGGSVECSCDWTATLTLSGWKREAKRPRR